MFKHSIITVAIFALATLLYVTGVTTEKQPWLFVAALAYWGIGFLWNSYKKGKNGD